MRISPISITKWQVAKKTQNIKAKPMICLMVDRSMTSKFLVETMEGNEPLGDGGMVCLGQAMDAWQQMPAKLLKAYNVVGVDKDGWMDCEPRPEVARNCVQVTKEMISNGDSGIVGNEDKFTIIGHWGATVNGEKNVQTGIVGDYIFQSQDDSTDVWIVKQKIFNNTYTIRA